MTTADPKILSGKRALLVEDQTLIALDTEMLLRELGATEVDTFTTADSAIAWLASAAPDVGVLDINLGETSSFSVAGVLHRRSTPFIFTTGYDDGLTIPESFVNVRIVRKPYTIEALSDALALSLDRRASTP